MAGDVGAAAATSHGAVSFLQSVDAAVASVRAGVCGGAARPGLAWPLRVYPADHCHPWRLHRGGYRRGRSADPVAAAERELHGNAPHYTLSPGTFVWRPPVPGYFGDRPDLFPTRGLLHHPCKVDVGLWEETPPAKRNAEGPSPRPEDGVSVVMATFNGAAHLSKQLESLLGQSHLPDEVIIGDDASTDGTLGLLRSFAATAPFPVTLVERPARLGYAQNFKVTAEIARGDLILFCDQDDIWDADKIRLVANAARETSALAYSHDLTVFFESGKSTSRPIPSYFDHLRGLGLPPDLSSKGCALAVRADFIRRFGWPPASSTVSHDAWIALLTTALGQRALIEAPLVQHRIHDRNTSGWLISEDEKQQSACESASTPFATMLDFYVKDWTRAWVPLLMDKLGATETLVDYAQAATSRDILASHLKD